MTIKIKVWDLPLRLFHWLMVLSVLGAVITGELGGNLIDWHGRFGELLLGLLVFRIIWGFIGSTHARFASFFPTPARVASYIKGQWQGAGHNPLGAISAFALLGVLAGVVTTGLYANDDIAFHGPLFDLIDKPLSDTLSAWHARLFYALIVLVPTHLAAIVFHVQVKKHDLITPMITGEKIVAKELSATPSGGGIVRFIVALTISGVVVWGAVHAAGYTTPPPAVSTPSF
jgi:cytochrome b